MIRVGLPEPRRGTRAAIVFAVVAALLLGAVQVEAACDRGAFRILVDPGHTPGAPGAISARGRTEHDFNLRLGEAIARELLARGYRQTDRFLPVDEAPASRIAYIRSAGADLLISVHHDSVQHRYLEPWSPDGETRTFSDRFSGWSLFVSGRNAKYQESLRFARLIGSSLLRRGWPFTRHHAERIPGEGRLWADPARGVYRFDGLAVLRASPGPAVLIEAGLIVNRTEETILADPARQAEMARAVGEAVDQFCASR